MPPNRLSTADRQTDPLRAAATTHERWLLGAIVVLFAGLSIAGVTWGLPGRKIDKYLFGDETPWSGEEIYRLAGAADKFSPTRGADVDVDALPRAAVGPIPLTGTRTDVAKIYLRYRLYTYQPDEMITMMALAGMKPRSLRLDPRLYQYGGLFIYPVAALIGAGGLTGLIDVHGDVPYYLDHPDEFGKFYLVARGYSGAWGLLGVVVVFAIGRRIGGSRTGLLAALLFTLMPVVVCMAHEGKPHLPGAVLMLWAVLFAMRCLVIPSSGTDAKRRGDRRDWWIMCICCGAALGMVLSSWPIFVLIPLTAMPEPRSGTPGRFRSIISQTAAGVGVALGVYFVTNPYVLINALVNRAVLASNFGNSLAMYEVARVGEGFVRALDLTGRGAGVPVVLLGVVALASALLQARNGRFGRHDAPSGTRAAGFSPRGVSNGESTPLANESPRRLKSAAQFRGTGRRKFGRNRVSMPLVITATAFFLQFVLIGAGKPDEYGRFGVFPAAALAIGTACVLTRRWTKRGTTIHRPAAIIVALWVGVLGGAEVVRFSADATPENTRLRAADRLADRTELATVVEPAPYCFPPINFSKTRLTLYRSHKAFAEGGESDDRVMVRINDRARLDQARRVYEAAHVPVDILAESRAMPAWLSPVDWLRRRGIIRLGSGISWAGKPVLIAGE